VGVKVGVGVKVPSRVNVAVGMSVFVGGGVRVAVGSGVHVGVGIGVGGGGKNRFATVLPNRADAIENANKTNANTSHCPPMRMYARRVR
jgi:hypothetical protein